MKKLIKMPTVFLGVMLFPISAFAAEGTPLPENPWERIEYVYNNLCHMPVEMAKALLILALAIGLTVVYYFGFIYKSDKNGGGKDE